MAGNAVHPLIGFCSGMIRTSDMQCQWRNKAMIACGRSCWPACAACAATSSAHLHTSSATTTLRRAFWMRSRCGALAGTCMRTWCTVHHLSRASPTCLARWPQMHVVKNKLVDMGLLGTDLRVPLILGVWCVLLRCYGSPTEKRSSLWQPVTAQELLDICSDRQPACTHLSTCVCMCRMSHPMMV